MRTDVDYIIHLARLRFSTETIAHILALPLETVVSVLEAYGE